MTKGIFVSVIVLFLLISGCINLNDFQDQSAGVNDNYKKEENEIKPPSITPMKMEIPVEQTGHLLIDNISLDLNSYYNRKWFNLYQADELDCSRMSTYFWKYVRDEYKVAPKIIVSYERQHAWLALRVRDVGDSTNYMHWNIKGIDYYFLEATIPRIVRDDNQRFIINGVPYTSAEFYNSSIYVFDTPQEANDFHADYTYFGGWNQEFRLLANDLDKIKGILN